MAPVIPPVVAPPPVVVPVNQHHLHGDAAAFFTDWVNTSNNLEQSAQALGHEWMTEGFVQSDIDALLQQTQAFVDHNTAFIQAQGSDGWIPEKLGADLLAENTAANALIDAIGAHPSLLNIQSSINAMNAAAADAVNIVSGGHQDQSAGGLHVEQQVHHEAPQEHLAHLWAHCG